MIFLFVALAILTFLSIIFFIVFPFVKKSFLKKNYVRSYGKEVYKIANFYDLYLINRLVLKSNDDSRIHIDHLLFGNKFIFVIKDYYFDGQLKGKEVDQSWVYYFGKEKDPKKEYVKNPLLENKARVNKLSILTGLNESFLISVILVNDGCDLSLTLNESDNQFVTKKSELKKLVEKVEARNVAPLNDEQLSYAAKDIAALNINK
jgi:hypothetical protein